MGASVTFHDRIGPERLAEAIEPMPADELRPLLESAVAETARIALGRTDVEVEITLCADPEMERLHFDHMGERGPTDVLSFPLHEWSIDGTSSHLADEDGAMPPGVPLMLGDVVLDVDRRCASPRTAAGAWPRSLRCWRSTARSICLATTTPSSKRRSGCAPLSMMCCASCTAAITMCRGAQVRSSIAPATP